MTLTDDELEQKPEEKDESSSVGSSNAATPREIPRIHPATDPPICEACNKLDLTFFDPSCPGCSNILKDSERTSIPDVFAILRQWTPQTQQNIESLVKEILKRGANPNDRDGLTDMTLLHYAAKAGAQGIGDANAACKAVNLLLSKGADIFIRCRWTNMTALHYAAYFDCPAVIKILLKASRGIDIDSTCSEFDQGSALHISSANLAFEAAKCLIQNGANVLLKDGLGRTPSELLSNSSNLDATSEMGKSIQKMKKMFTDAEPATPKKSPPNYDLVPGKVTLGALGIQLGERVVVGGMKHGTLRYCGPTEFAAGIWAGVELDEPVGKNDGSVGEISYFKCSEKFGIFAPMSKIGKEHTSIRHNSSKTPSPLKQFQGQRVDVSKVTARVDTGLHQRTSTGGSDTGELEIGDRVMVAGQRRGTLKYIGGTKFSPGVWYGVELDHPVGKNDGCVNGERYFTCLPKHGVFAPPSRIKILTSANHRSSLESIDSIPSYDVGRSEMECRLSGGFRDASGSLSSLQSTSSKESARNGRPKTIGSPQRKYGQASESSGMKLQEGMAVFCNNELGTIRYIGPAEFSDGIWLGVELRTPKGKNDGSVQGTRYFTCKPDHGLLVRPSKVTVRGINGAKLIGGIATSPEK